MQKDKKEEEVTEEDLSNKPADGFTEDQLLSSWGKFAESHKQNPQFYAALTKNKPTLKDNFLIEHFVDNKVQENDMSEKKQDLLSFIRNDLNNFKTQLNVVVSKKQANDKPYTSQDKYKSMLAKNPALGKLKSQLNLEIDF